jgi:putative glycosyltransferase (TIGR04372 family)
VRLQPKIRRAAEAAVRAATAPGLHRVANFYLRQKNTTDAMSSMRNGGPFGDYMPAFEYLTKRGFVVLLNGDMKIPADLRDAWKGRLLDAKACGLESGLFSLYAATESRISIGEPGGGFWLPTINAIPSLMINAFPLYMGREHTTLLFKSVSTKAGHRIPPATLLRERLYDHQCTDLQVLTNSPAEISAAVEEFVNFVETGEGPAMPAALLESLPWDSFARICRARYSPVWLKQDDRITAHDIAHLGAAE